MSFLTAGVGSLAGGALSGIGSLVGSSETASAQKQAANTQLQMYQQTAANLSPYNTAGQSATSSALSLAQGSPTGGGPDYISQAAQNTPYNVLTQAGLEQTPGYQFINTQGLKATQAAAAARGLGVSGAALKGAASYATGLASNTYQNQFNDAQQQFTDYLNLNASQQNQLTNQFNRLNSLSTIGENAAAQTGAQGTQAASNYGNYLSQSGQSTGGGTVAASNAASNALNQYTGLNYWQGQSGGTGGYQSGNVSGNVNNSDLLQGATNVGGNTWYS